MDTTRTSTRQGAAGSKRKSSSPWKSLWTCCLAGTANRDDLDDAYEASDGAQLHARGEPSSAASQPKPLISPSAAGISDPRADAAPAGHHVLPTVSTAQEFSTAQTGSGQHALHDAVASSGARSDQQRRRVSSSSDTASSKDQPVSHALPAAVQPTDVPALRTDQQYPAPPQAAGTVAALSETDTSAPFQVGPVSALPLDQPSDVLNAPQLLEQHRLAPAQQQHFAADATAGFMQGPHSMQQRPISLHPVQHRHMYFALDPIDESPRPRPGESPRTPKLASAEGLAAATASGAAAAAAGATAGAAAPASAGKVESPRHRQVSLAQGLGDADIYPAAGPAAAAAADAAAGKVESPRQPQVSLAQGLADADIHPAPGPAAAAAAGKVESPRQPQVSLAQGLADADIWMKPESPAAAAAAAAARTPDFTAHSAAAGGDVGSPAAAAAYDQSSIGASAAQETAEQAERRVPAAAVGSASTSGASSGLTPPASPRSAMATPFTQRGVQALVTQELIVSNSNKQATSSNSSGSTKARPASQQQQQESGMAGNVLPQQQQQQVAARKQRRPLSEEVEEAVVTQIRPARATSLTTGADPSRVWALVTQFDSSKQHPAHTAAVPASMTVSTGNTIAGRAAAADAPQRSSADAPNAGTAAAAAAAAAAAKAAFGGSSSSPGAAVPPSADEIYAAFSDQISSPAASKLTAAAADSSLGSSGQPIQLVGRQARMQQLSPPTSPHSTGWSEDSNVSDVPMGLKKIKVGKCKAPVAIATASAENSSSNVLSGNHVLSGSSASSAAARLQSPGAAGTSLAHHQQQQGVSDSGPDSFIPHFTAASGSALNLTSGAQGGQGSSGLGAAQGSGRTAGLPPRPRSSRDLTGLGAGANNSSSSNSNSAGWATGNCSSTNNSGTKYFSAPGLHIRTGTGSAAAGAGGAVLSPEKITSSSRWSVDEPQPQHHGSAVSGLQAGDEECWSPFTRMQQQQGGGGRSSEESEGGGGKAWEVLPVMPLSPLKVPRGSVVMNVEESDTPPTPRTSVVGVSNSIIDYMLSEEGIPLVPTSGVDEAAGVHGLDSPFLSGPAIFRSTSGKGFRGLSQVSSWGGGATTPRFSHSSSFSGYGGSNQGPLAVERTSHSSSFAGAGGLNRGPRGDWAFGRQLLGGRGRGRRLSMGDEGDVSSTATSGWQEFQSRGVRSFDMPVQQGAAVGRVRRLSGPSTSTGAEKPAPAAVRDRNELGEQPMTPRGGNRSGSIFSSSNAERVSEGAATADASLSSQQQVVPVLPRTSVQQATTSAAVAGGTGNVAQCQSDTASVRSGISSPVSQLAARASAVAAAVAAAAAAGETGNVGAGTSSSFNSSQDNSAAFATSASNLASDAALFSRSGWASMHPQQQQQQQQQQWGVLGMDGGNDHGPMSFEETPKESKP